MSQSAATSETSGQAPRWGILAGVGPALITASVVLGPGSILSASKIGYQYGFQMAWALAAAVLLMIGMTALSARLGVMFDGTLCDELARRAGRPVAVLTGVSLFLVAACFQFGNNLGVLAALEPFVDIGGVWPTMLIVGLNSLIIIALYGFRKLYAPVERLMKLLVGLMLVGFAGNLLLARPDLLELLRGLIPQMPEGSENALMPRWQPEVVEGGKVVQEGKVIDALTPVVALFATTFSVGGAFYQSYLVREKGWTRKDLRQGLVDSTVGICVLGLLTMMIMVTAAAVLHGNASVPEFKTAGDVARQLEPAFGPAAKGLFCLGIFAGAFSSFLVNAMIGGTILSDGLGLGGSIDGRWPKLFTVLALMTGMGVAVAVRTAGFETVNLIIFAQAMTVLAIPVLAAGMLWLATRSDLVGEREVPTWMKIVGAVALAATLFLAVRNAIKLVLPFLHAGG